MNVNAQTGAIGALMNGTASSVVLPDGWVRLTVRFPLALSNNLWIYMATTGDTSGLAYPGNGTAELKVRNVRVTQTPR